MIISPSSPGWACCLRVWLFLRRLERDLSGRTTDHRVERSEVYFIGRVGYQSLLMGAPFPSHSINNHRKIFGEKGDGSGVGLFGCRHIGEAEQSCVSPARPKSLIGRVVLEKAFVGDDARRLQQISACRVVEAASDKNRNGVEVSRFDDQFLDDFMARVRPLAIVFGFNAEWARIMSKLEKSASFCVEFDPIFFGGCLPIAAICLRLVEVKLALVGKATVARKNLMEALKDNDFEGVAAQIMKVAFADTGIERS